MTNTLLAKTAVRTAMSLIMIATGVLLSGRQATGQTSASASAASAAGKDKPKTGERSIVVHCGSSMRPPVEKLAEEFSRRYHVKVHFNFGGTETLLPQVELGVKGDIFVCHDPFAEMLEKKGGLIERYETVGYLEPVMIVPVGNPKNISALADMAKPGLKIGWPDARFNTCGQLVQKAWSKMGLTEAIRKNTRMEGRKHFEVAMALISGHIDAGVVWNFAARYYEGRLEWVNPKCNFPETRVTVCLLQNTTDREMAEKFMEFALSKESRAEFERGGYVKKKP